MKKKILAAVLFASAVGGAAAADGQIPVRVALQLVKSDKPLWSAETSALEGQRTPVIDTEEHSYVASCDWNAAGALVPHPATFFTGIEAYVTPMRVDDDGVIISVAFSQKELTAMKSVTSRGCTVDQPSIHTRQTSTQVRVKQGEKIELPVAVPTSNEREKYTLVVRTL